MTDSSIASAFGQYFDIRLATCQESLQQVFRLRFQVYCQELRYERAEDYPDCLERDLYDDQALHCLLIHRSTQAPIGCVRLIDAAKGDPARPLPFERYWSPASALSIALPELDRVEHSELSRLAVIETFRRRQTDEKKPISLTEAETPGAGERRSGFPYIPVGLFVAGIAMFLRSPSSRTFAMMEPRLVRLLKRFGILFSQAGEVVDCRGPRAPFFLPRSTATTSMRPEVSELLSYVDQQLFGRPSERGGAPGEA